jgi:hypothetical protein
MKNRNKKKGEAILEQRCERTYREKIVHLVVPREGDRAGLPWVSRAKNSRPIKKEMVCSEDFGDAVPC